MLRFPFTLGRGMRARITATVAVAMLVSGLTTGSAFADANFRKWVSSFRTTAIQNGVSPSTFDRAFRGVDSPDPEVLRKARFQPEFSEPVWNYIDNRVNEHSVAVGQSMAKKWGPWLQRIEQRFSVDRNILLAIWSMESNYGEILKRDDVMMDTIRSLATLAYADQRRAKFGRTQLIAAMKILQTGDIDRGHLTGSWAGAMGHTQFIPTSYQAYAVDMDGNGKRDIWNSVPDALGTAANLLHRNGWQPGRTWGYEVVLPAGRKFPSGSLSAAEWQRLGVVRANGRPFPDANEKVTLKVLDGRQGPAFLMAKNFSVIKRYNNADKYALAVGLLADRIGGYQGLRQDWNRPFTPITMNEREELQTHLKALGYYDGNIDGKIGATSRKAIEAFQQRNGLQPDGHPSKEVLTVLRRR
ncbi:lytic murein transglycosylase [Ochrobactrum sp. MYb15]|uniref:Lytic murein transglycosylase n=1 Tax=Brucella pituitosa TaxID=571256 RepID=A0ABS3K543_9HYPH|nr:MULTISPECIES: lytic murein transglycosylase [Brucella]PQZ48114.1 lytic murein transglycosylase [Ochrobactrum sp. MYb19]PRA54378.1 lytic murein transglycosylase [Ochrobactrum sp. MYb68]PRA64299.1 lytic murein transglycosylase [Ochrobactrum sp. MYb18]PRA75191.1 lytic murein transglycosylase [Brucella thiophenivorans]PRA89598.1 lytic murein transglycosylase [Ochrobactrum sp. MYb14]PRA96627.1 lytic murein transglycosylase [Ochrobactrum sp. MYb15]TCQ76195.1 membrane-bound lytic murein transgly